jgi:2-methylfumaryl-CoA isomerase
LIQGNHDGSAAVDYTVNATMGFPQVTGPDSLREPVNHVLPAWDIACGLYAALGLIAAERRRRLTGEGSRMTLALADVALAVTGHLGFLAEAQVTGADRERIGNYLYGGFARDFTTSDGERVMVVALTGRHFADLAAVTGLTAAFAKLERLLGADFSTDGDRYAHREVLASLLRPWFAGRELAQVARELDGTSVLWSRYRRFTEMAAEEAKAGNPLLREITQPGVGPLLGDFLGLSPEQIGALMERGVVGGPSAASPRDR